MNTVLKRTVGYVTPYKGSFFLSVLFNTLYAMLNVLALAMVMPVLEILFNEQSNTLKKPVYDGLGSLRHYVIDSIYYWAQALKEDQGILHTLIFFCISFLITFFFRNFFSISRANLFDFT